MGLVVAGTFVIWLLVALIAFARERSDRQAEVDALGEDVGIPRCGAGSIYKEKE